MGYPKNSRKEYRQIVKDAIELPKGSLMIIECSDMVEQRSIAYYLYAERALWEKEGHVRSIKISKILKYNKYSIEVSSNSSMSKVLGRVLTTTKDKENQENMKYDVLNMMESGLDKETIQGIYEKEGKGRIVPEEWFDLKRN